MFSLCTVHLTKLQQRRLRNVESEGWGDWVVYIKLGMKWSTVTGNFLLDKSAMAIVLRERAQSISKPISEPRTS